MASESKPKPIGFDAQYALEQGNNRDTTTSRVGMGVVQKVVSIAFTAAR